MFFLSYLGGGGPLLLGEELVLVAALDSTSDTVDALVGLAVVEALEGLLGNVVLLLEEVVISVSNQLKTAVSKRFSIPSRIHRIEPNWRIIRSHRAFEGREEIRVPETHLAVAGGVHVPGGGGLEDLVEPRPADDEGGERVLHCCGLKSGYWAAIVRRRRRRPSGMREMGMG